MAAYALLWSYSSIVMYMVGVHLHIFLIIVLHLTLALLWCSALIVGKDSPCEGGLDYVRQKWKEAIRNPANCQLLEGTSPEIQNENERRIRKAVGRGRYVSNTLQIANAFLLYLVWMLHASVYLDAASHILQFIPCVYSLSLTLHPGDTRNGGDDTIEEIQKHEKTIWGGSGCGSRN